MRRIGSSYPDITEARARIESNSPNERWVWAADKAPLHSCKPGGKSCRPDAQNPRKPCADDDFARMDIGVKLSGATAVVFGSRANDDTARQEALQVEADVALGSGSFEDGMTHNRNEISVRSGIRFCPDMSHHRPIVLNQRFNQKSQIAPGRTHVLKDCARPVKRSTTSNYRG